MTGTWLLLNADHGLTERDLVHGIIMMGRGLPDRPEGAGPRLRLTVIGSWRLLRLQSPLEIDMAQSTVNCCCVGSRGWESVSRRDIVCRAVVEVWSEDLPRSRLNAVAPLRFNPPGRGRELRSKIETRMKDDLAQGHITGADLAKMKEMALADKYGCSRGPAAKARKAVLSEIGGEQLETIKNN